MKEFEVLFASIWNLTYSDGEGDGAGDGADGADGADGEGTSDPVIPPGKAITQAELNTLLAKEKRKHQAQTQKALDELNALKAKANITQEERTDLEKRIETLQNDLLTKEELSKKQIEKARKQHETDVERLTNESNAWKSRYTDSTIMRSITDAAAENKAFSPSQIVAILRPNTHLVEGIDSEGQPTGKFEPKIDFEDSDDKGKPVKLTLTVKEAVKRMREMEEHQNLFQGEGTGGLGIQNRKGKKASLQDAAKLGPEAYREARKAMGLDN